MAAQANHNATTIVILNHKEKPFPINHTDIHIILTIPPNTIQYNPTLEWPKHLHHLENQYTTIVCIYNERSPPGHHHTLNTLTPNILGLYNIHVKINLIESTPLRNEGKCSHEWHTTPPKHSCTKTNHSTQPLPTKLYKTYPLSLIHNNAYALLARSYPLGIKAQAI